MAKNDNAKDTNKLTPLFLKGSAACRPPKIMAKTNKKGINCASVIAIVSKTINIIPKGYAPYVRVLLLFFSKPLFHGEPDQA